VSELEEFMQSFSRGYISNFEGHCLELTMNENQKKRKKERKRKKPCTVLTCSEWSLISIKEESYY